MLRHAPAAEADSIWTPDGKGIITVYAKEGRANAGRFDAATGKETDITSGNQVVSHSGRSADGSVVWFFRFRHPHE